MRDGFVIKRAVITILHHPQHFCFTFRTIEICRVTTILFRFCTFRPGDIKRALCPLPYQVLNLLIQAVNTGSNFRQ